MLDRELFDYTYSKNLIKFPSWMKSEVKELVWKHLSKMQLNDLTAFYEEVINREGHAFDVSQWVGFRRAKNLGYARTKKIIHDEVIRHSKENPEVLSKLYKEAGVSTLWELICKKYGRNWANERR